MTIESQQDIDQLSKIERIAAIAIQEMKKSAKPGMTTMELDDIGHRVQRLGQHMIFRGIPV